MTAVVPFLATLAAGCYYPASSAALPMVRTRAVYDLDCPGKDIRIEQEFGGRFKAIGCAQKARYQAACDGNRCVVRGEDEPFIPSQGRP
jgi:hypothetical protein